MHILFLSDNFPPEVNAPASRTFEHCREWVRAGHEVTVITCAPNFPKGKVFDGYRNRLWQKTTLEGIRVIRVWTFISANAGFFRRILDYVSFMVSAVLAAPFVRRVDVVIGTSPQLFSACGACIVGFYKRVPYVFELRDLWPESIKAVGAINNPRIYQFLERIEMLLYRRAALIVSVTHAFKRVLIARGIDASKISVVTNGVDHSAFKAREKDHELAANLGLADKFVVGYIGTHGMAHALETVLDAADAVRRWPNGDRYRFLLLGDGAQKSHLQAYASERNLDNVIFVDTVPRAEVARYWSLLDVAVIHLKKTELFKTVIPSKLFECMGMGIPVLHGVEGESAEIVTDEGVGLVFEPQNVDALCNALKSISGDQELYARLSDRGIEASLKYARANLAHKMLGKLEALVSAIKVVSNSSRKVRSKASRL